MANLLSKEHRFFDRKLDTNLNDLQQFLLQKSYFIGGFRRFLWKNIR